jgi:hypothetical protein
MRTLTKTTPIKLTKGAGKKKMQLALKAEIEKIDARLKELGVAHDTKFLVLNALTNWESPQNTVNIQSMTDISQLSRWLTNYEKLKEGFEAHKKEFGIETPFCSQNAQIVDNIIHDLRLRMKMVVNGAAINSLTQARAKLLPFLDEESRLFNTLQEVSNLYKAM